MTIKGTIIAMNLLEYFKSLTMFATQVSNNFLNDSMESSGKLTAFLKKHHRISEHLVLVFVYPSYFVDLFHVLHSTRIVRKNVKFVRTKLSTCKGDYMILRTVYDKMEEARVMNEKYLNMEIAPHALWRRLLLRPIVNMCRSVELVRVHIASLLKDMEKTPFKQGDVFVKISESEIWENKCKQYAALI